jgi:hypothetical protein
MKSECLWMTFIHEWHVKEMKILIHIINYVFLKNVLMTYVGVNFRMSFVRRNLGNVFS